MADGKNYTNRSSIVNNVINARHAAYSHRYY